MGLSKYFSLPKSETRGIKIAFHPLNQILF